MSAPPQPAIDPVASAPLAPGGAPSSKVAFGTSTPARIRLISAGTAVLAVLLAVFGWISVSRRDQSLDHAGAAAARLISVQEIRSAVIEADSIATTSFLQGGLEKTDQRARYEERLSTAASSLALLSNGLTGSSLDQLTTASSTLEVFSGLVEQARANNRQGFPVGAAYQRQASALVRDSLLTSLDAIEQQSRSDVNAEIESAHKIGWVLPVAGVIVLGAMVAGSVWLFRRTRRLINVPVGLAAVLTVVVVGISLVSMGDAVSSADGVVTGNLLQADRFSQARVAAFEARSDEALTLINRGNGQANEDAYQQARATVLAVLDGRDGREDLSNGFADYDENHQDLRSQDEGGNWDGAVETLTGDSAESFAAFSADIADVVQSRASLAESALNDAGSGLGTSRLVLIIGALIAAGLVTVGYGQRLREYR
ncbi:MAG: hypothetical protein ABIR32_14340 [Ilumatobacteraceae bacterium]